MSLEQSANHKSDAVTRATSEASALFSAFASGASEEMMKPVQGAEQIMGKHVDLKDRSVQVTTGEKVAHAAGAMISNAAVFYATSTALRYAKMPLLAPIAAGAVLGLLDPVKEGHSSDRLGNTVRGAATMAIMERMPGFLKERSGSSDFISNLKNVVATGATAGAVDTQLQSLVTKHEFAPLSTTAGASLSWAATGAAFHLGSLKLGTDYTAINCQKPHLMLLGTENDGGQPVREFLSSMEPFGVRTRMMNVKDYPGVTKMLAQGEQLPVAIFPDGSRVSGDIGTLSKRLGLHTQPSADHYRVLVVGGGPAGVQSAINAASELPAASQKVAVVADIMGGQARFTSSVKNFLGFPEITGQNLMTNGINGAQARGAEMIVNRVKDINFDGSTHNVTLNDGTKMTADSVVLATGMGYNQLKAPGIERLNMKGVYTLADASVSSSAKGKNIFLVGAGNSAGQAAINFSKYASEVHMIVRGDNLEKSMSEYLIKEVQRKPNITVHLNTEVQEVAGQDRLEQIIAKTQPESGAADSQPVIKSFKADGLYAYIGGKPNTGFLHGSNIRLNDKGFIVTGDTVNATGGFTQGSVDRSPLPFETSMPGVFAIGDVNAQNLQKRIISAAGEGGKVIGSLHSYLADVPITMPNMRAGADGAQLNSKFAIKLPTLGAALLSKLSSDLAQTTTTLEEARADQKRHNVAVASNGAIVPVH